MAYDFVPMVPGVLFEPTMWEGVDGTTIYGWPLVSQDNALTFWFILGDGVPSETYLPATIVHGLYYDTTNKKLYIRTATTTWTVVGAQS